MQATSRRLCLSGGLVNAARLSPRSSGWAGCATRINPGCRTVDRAAYLRWYRISFFIKRVAEGVSIKPPFVSLLSSAGIPIEDIVHLGGYANTRTTEKVYRKELRPVLRRGAKAMDDIFKAHHEASEPPLCPPRPVRTKQSAENDTDALSL
jgi:hypothetical protein